MLHTYINEFHGFFNDGSFTQDEQIRNWALFGKTYFENIFLKIDDFEVLKSTYLEKTKTVNNRIAKIALYYFYKYREKQLLNDIQEGIEERKPKPKWFTLDQKKLNYYEQVITNTYAKAVLDTVKQNNGRCSERQYTILKLAIEGNITPSLFGTKN